MRGLYGMIDTSASPDRTHDQLCDALLAAGVRILQLRMKGASAADLRATAERLLPRIQAAGATLLLNDHVALAASLPGVGAHIGQDDLPPSEARALLGAERLLGWSTHDLDQLATAAALPIDYVGFGPIFSAATKHLADDDARDPMKARGIKGLKAAVAVCTLPLVAIGGIDLGNLEPVLSTGVGSVAVLSAVSTAPDPLAVARSVQRAFERRAC